MPRSSAERIGAGLGRGLSAFLAESEKKDLREEQDLQRRNLRALLKAYVDPKTELGPGALADLQLGTGQIPKIQPEQEETFKDMMDRIQKEEFETLSPAERKHKLFGIPLPKEEAPPKPGVKERQTERLLDLGVEPATVPATAEEATALERAQAEVPILEKQLGVAEKEEKEPSATARFANAKVAKSLVDRIVRETGVSSSSQYMQLLKHVTDQLDAGVPLEDVNIPKLIGEGEFSFPATGDAEGGVSGDTEIAKAQQYVKEGKMTEEEYVEWLDQYIGNR